MVTGGNSRSVAAVAIRDPTPRWPRSEGNTAPSTTSNTTIAAPMTQVKGFETTLIDSQYGTCVAAGSSRPYSRSR